MLGLEGGRAGFWLEEQDIPTGHWRAMLTDFILLSQPAADSDPRLGEMPASPASSAPPSSLQQRLLLQSAADLDPRL